MKQSKKATAKKTIVKKPVKKAATKKAAKVIKKKQAKKKTPKHIPEKHVPTFPTKYAGKPLTKLLAASEEHSAGKFLVKLNVNEKDYGFIRHALLMEHIAGLSMESCDSQQKGFTGMTLFANGKPAIKKIVERVNQLSPRWVKPSDFVPASKVIMK